MKIITCNSNIPLARDVAIALNTSLCDVTVRRFADMEVFVEIHENVRGKDVFVIQSTSAPANDHLMELLIMLDALRRGSAKRITAVIPYFGYARQDRKSAPRTPISAKLVANLLVEAGAHRILTLDLHAMQIQGFFDIPVDNLYAAPLFARDILTHYEKNVMIVSPDVGGVVRARQLAQRLKADLAIIDKRRERAGVSEVMNIIGDVQGRHCLLVDDIVDSGGSLCNAARAIIEQGKAATVGAYVTHGVLTGQAVEKIASSPIDRLTLTNSIPLTTKHPTPHNIRQISIANLLAQAIRAIANEGSISSLFQ
ncbi:MAG: ribose-phosphate pyrophosphokinase [Acetobacter sp.]|nr:ribose-phosphate pyrophosphokinase [Acetobacter sp.]MBO6044193.1 ribose-phosphate pyrophosphokinase [Acetobacter sp.]MBQ5470294.1 ribose-phosphate pyrophosphokinase [Acetobacter sp.]MBQ5479560.1 ribose-phosphate pyrophosphokinase [Acetobacter sp.]MBQ5516257.1 ribose-phosphate pyrophosphokinase [Acetobacter sp.]